MADKPPYGILGWSAIQRLPKASLARLEATGNAFADVKALEPLAEITELRRCFQQQMVQHKTHGEWDLHDEQICFFEVSRMVPNTIVGWVLVEGVGERHVVGLKLKTVFGAQKEVSFSVWKKGVLRSDGVMVEDGKVLGWDFQGPFFFNIFFKRKKNQHAHLWKAHLKKKNVHVCRFFKTASLQNNVFTMDKAQALPLQFRSLTLTGCPLEEQAHQVGFRCFRASKPPKASEGLVYPIETGWNQSLCGSDISWCIRIYEWSMLLNRITCHVTPGWCECALRDFDLSTSSAAQWRRGCLSQSHEIHHELTNIMTPWKLTPNPGNRMITFLSRELLERINLYFQLLLRFWGVDPNGYHEMS